MARLVLESEPSVAATEETAAFVCVEHDGTGCTAWLETALQERAVVGGGWPPLTIADSAEILGGAFVVLAIAWGFRQLVIMIRGGS